MKRNPYNKAFRRLISSKEYRGVEGQIHLFEARAEELKQKADELLHPPSIPVDEESDVGLAINLLLEKKRGDRPVGFLSRAIQAIENGKSRFAPSLQILDTLSGSANAPFFPGRIQSSKTPQKEV